MRFTTGIAYDDETLKHECYCKRLDLHLENPRRLFVIYEELKKSNLLDHCEIIRSYCATIDMLTECHEYVTDRKKRTTNQKSLFFL
jgi:hypothetical protein